MAKDAMVFRAAEKRFYFNHINGKKCHEKRDQRAMHLPDSDTFATWLKRRMLFLGLNSDSLAKQMNMKIRAIMRWRCETIISSNRPPSTKHDELAVLLGVPAAEIRFRLARDRRNAAAHAAECSAQVVA
jgi:hypothetical protein